MSTKVYCGYCKFLKRGRLGGDYDVECIYKDNLSDTWEYPKYETENSPRNLNAGNDCQWFEKKEKI